MPIHIKSAAPRPRLRPRRLSAVVAAITAGTLLFLTGCASETSKTPSVTSDTSLLAEHSLAGLNAREVIKRLDTMPVADRPAELIASVRPDELVLTDQQENEAMLPMPADEFYLSVAPYVDQTHECFLHSLTTCLGELADPEVKVTVTNSATDEVVLDDTLTTFNNGFVGLWVPRDIDATLTVVSNGRTATQIISTRDDDATCLTTLQLT